MKTLSYQPWQRWAMWKRLLALLLSAGFFLALLGLSGWTLGRALIRDVSPMEIEAVLNGVGVSFLKEEDYRFLLEINGFKPVWLELEGCEKGRCTIVALSAGFEEKVSLELLNEWNRGYRFSRAYLSDKGTPWIEWELDLAGGVTRDTLRRFFSMFSEAVLPLFAEHIGFKP